MSECLVLTCMAVIREGGWGGRGGRRRGRLKEDGKGGCIVKEWDIIDVIVLTVDPLKRVSAFH